MPYRPVILLVIAALVVVAADKQTAAQTGKVVKRAQSLLWQDFDISGFSKGLKLASIYGDYTVPDGSFTIRLKFPDLYRIPPHYYPKGVSLTVLSGILLLTYSHQGEIYRAGDFLHIPATTPHFGVVKGETIVQFQGVGPFEVILAK
jgi:hypothetical protein